MAGVYDFGTDIDISGPTTVLTTDIASRSVVDVYIDGDAQAKYELRGASSEVGTVFDAPIAAFQGSSSYAKPGLAVAAPTVQLDLTQTNGGAGDTADVLIAAVNK